jgi:hypothetical protein
LTVYVYSNSTLDGFSFDAASKTASFKATNSGKSNLTIMWTSIKGTAAFRDGKADKIEGIEVVDDQILSRIRTILQDLAATRADLKPVEPEVYMT